MRTWLAFRLMRMAARLDLIAVVAVSEAVVGSLIEGAIADGLVEGLVAREKSSWQSPTKLN